MNSSSLTCLNKKGIKYLLIPICQIQSVVRFFQRWLLSAAFSSFPWSVLLSSTQSTKLLSKMKSKALHSMTVIKAHDNGQGDGSCCRITKILPQISRPLIKLCVAECICNPSTPEVRWDVKPGQSPEAPETDTLAYSESNNREILS